MKIKKLLYNQTLYDLAIQEYGHVSGIFFILEDNPGIIADFSDVPLPGTDVLIRDVPVITDSNKVVVSILSDKEKEVVSGIPANYIPTPHYAENGYWEDGYSQ